MSDINKLMQQLTELNQNRDRIADNVKFLEENASILSKDDWDSISMINHAAQEISPLLDKLELINKWAKSELLSGLHLSENNPASELLNSNDIQEIPK